MALRQSTENGAEMELTYRMATEIFSDLNDLIDAASTNGK